MRYEAIEAPANEGGQYEYRVRDTITAKHISWAKWGDEAKKLAHLLNEAHSRSGADELRAALEEIDAITLVGPHVGAKEAFEAALAVFIKARNIAHTALAKHPSKSGAEEMETENE